MSTDVDTTRAASGDGARPAHVPDSWMSPEAMAAFISERLEDRVLGTTVAFGQLTVNLEPAALPDAAELCKNDDRLAMDFYDFNGGVDLREEGFAVVTRLYSTRHRHEVRLRVIAPGGREAPVVPSISHLYRGANWHEREAYDMFGIEFEGHPGLLPRILTVENFEGWPLRKEFLLSTREAKPWPGLKEPKEAEAEDEAVERESAPTGMSADEKAAAAKAKAERAKAKAAEMRAKKARERAAEQQAEAGQDVEGAAAAQVAVGKGEQSPQTPEGAAEVAESGIAKDAAAGAVSGDTDKGAPQDKTSTDQPVHDRADEERVGEGAEGMPSGAPGVEAEGRHGGAKEQAGDRPAAETPGMTSPSQRSEAARTPEETPAPGPESNRPTESDAQPDPDGSDGPSAGTKPLAEDVDESGDEAREVATEPSRDRAAPPPVPGGRDEGEGEDNQ